MATGENGGSGLAGRLLAGRYRVTGTLGSGGMGVVCRAHDDVLGREVAVKVLRAHPDTSAPEFDGLRSRMRREARAAARVRHPGVVTVFDVVEDEGRPVIVMELVDGVSLEDLVARDEALDPLRAAAIGAEVAGALEAAHRSGVLHRDVKPGNVLLERGGRIVLTDFGIASFQAAEAEAEAKLTRAGEVVGSLDYLPPERARGEEPGPAADVWSLGVTLYAAVERTSPFHRASVWLTLNAIVTEELPEPRRAGPLAPVLREMTRKDPAHRPSAERAARLLRAVADGGREATPPAGSAAPPPTAAPRETPPPAAPGPVGGATVPYPPSARPDPPAAGGFGPPPTASLSGARPPRPYQPAALASRPAAQDTTATPAVRPSDRRRVLLAAGAVAVLLAGGGAAYALTGGSGGHGSALGGVRHAGASFPTSTSPSPSASRTPSAPAPTPSARPTPSPTRPTAPPPATVRPTPPKRTTAPPAKPPTPVCHGIGGGKYDCHVWRKAESISAGGTREGVLNAGTNYFYCQTNLHRRETYGSWTNVWWARTDDDSGNRDVYVSDVYISGGANDQPVPGLPTC